MVRVSSSVARLVASFKAATATLHVFRLLCWVLEWSYVCVLEYIISLSRRHVSFAVGFISLPPVAVGTASNPAGIDRIEYTERGLFRLRAILMDIFIVLWSEAINFVRAGPA